MKKIEMAKMIDHTLLNACATKSEIIKLCTEAKYHQFASVCVNPCYVKIAAEELKDSDVKVCTVIGFPLGAETSASKAFSAQNAVENGAEEIDMVINLGRAKMNDFDFVESDIKAVVESSKNAGLKLQKNVIVKVILETCYLSDEEIKNVCLASKNGGADFVKTSTGFGTPKALDGKSLANGASVYHVALMKKTVGVGDGALKIKASGGIRSTRAALDLINAGANRIGTSSGIAILQGLEE